MKYKLCDWEENGYDDSDGYTAYWDSDTQTVGKDYTWSTRFASTGDREQYEYPTLEVVEAACQWLADYIFATIRAAELRDVLEPQDCKRNDLVRLTQEHKSRKTGQTLTVGTVIRVNDCQAFGTFYARGYNQPGRHNRSIIGTVLGKPSVLVRVPLVKCRKNEEPMSDAELRERAIRLSRDCQFGKALSARHAWDSNNWASAALEKSTELVTA